MSKKIIDVSGITLTPSFQGSKCLGNGEHKGYECCCDECDYYLECFPQYKCNINIIRLKCRIKNSEK